MGSYFSSLVSTNDISDGAVTSAKIADGTIVAIDIANGAITGAKIGAGQVDNTVLGANSVDSSKIIDGSIVNVDVAAGAAIAYSKLNLATSIVNGDVAAGAAIAYSKLNLAGSIATADIAAAAVTAAKIGTDVAGAIVQTGTYTARPVASAVNAGTLYLSTDMFGGTVHRSTGAAWVLFSPGPHGAMSEQARIDAAVIPSLTATALVGSGMLAGGTITTLGTLLSVTAIQAGMPSAAIQSAAVAGSVGGMSVTPSAGFNSSKPSFRAITRMHTITTARMWAGWFSASPFGSDTIAAAGWGFRFSTAAGDTTIKAVSYDGALHVVDTGITANSGDTFDMSIIQTSSTSAIALVVQINGGLNGGVTTAAAVALPIPGAGPTAPVMVCGLETLGAVARQVDFAMCMVQFGALNLS